MSKISDKDKKDWDNFLSKNENLPDKDKDLGIGKPKKTKTFDLHGYSLDEANIEINNLIYESFSQGLNKLIIVTGKGLHSNIETDVYSSKDYSKLKHSVPEYIKSDGEISKNVSSISNASIEDGGEGALIIRLKKL